MFDCLLPLQALLLHYINPPHYYSPESGRNERFRHGTILLRALMSVLKIFDMHGKLFRGSISKRPLSDEDINENCNNFLSRVLQNSWYSVNISINSNSSEG